MSQKKEDDYYKPIKINSKYIQYQSNGDKDKKLSIKEYLNMIKPYISKIINYQKDERKIQLTMKINFISSTNSEKTRSMNTVCDSVEFMLGCETDEIIEKRFESLLQRYQEGLERVMRGSEFIYDGVELLQYKIHKIRLNRDGCIDSPKWLKKKKATINPINEKDDKYFQYAGNVPLNC